MCIRDRNKPGPSTWEQSADNVMVAGRWNDLARWTHTILEQGALCDERTALVIDMDKTVIGARGRNSQVIDEARLAGLRATMIEMLGEKFNQIIFEEAYRELNQPRYHRFTADNQDYLAYVCLIISAGVISLRGLLDCIAEAPDYGFLQFVRWSDTRLATGSQPELADMHFSFLKRLEVDDPTPFKSFRRLEYLATTGRMGQLLSLIHI